MTTTVVKAAKQFALFSVFIVAILSCESDIEGIGTNIVENGVFTSNQYNSDVKTYNKNILKRKAKSLGQYLLGVYHTNDFGKLEASIVTQLAPPVDFDFGTDPVIDTVILTIPYQSTRIGNIDVDVAGETIAVPEFELDSIFGDQTVDFNLNVYELTSYLNTLDPANPSELLEYYTDYTYNYNANPLYSGTFKPNAKDTVVYVNRPEVIIDYNTMAYDVDTIKNTNSVPAIRLPLDKTFFVNNFLQNANLLESNEAFVTFFKGLYIEATENTNSKASVLSLNLSLESNVTIYYTNTIVVDETIYDVDQNGDGVIEAGANVRTKQSATFIFSGITTNTYARDYTTSTANDFLTSPNTVNGEEKLFVQGAAGSIALIDLFTNDDLNTLRTNNWLINEANLTFYIDQTAENLNIPEKLFLYNYDENAQIIDMFTQGPDLIDGNLLRDDDENPLSYTVDITDYVSKILTPTDPITSSTLAIRVYNPLDIPTSTLDTEIKDYSWSPKGVVLHGNQSSDVDKRVKLEITYTELN